MPARRLRVLLNGVERIQLRAGNEADDCSAVGRSELERSVWAVAVVVRDVGA